MVCLKMFKNMRFKKKNQPKIKNLHKNKEIRKQYAYGLHFRYFIKSCLTCEKKGLHRRGHKCLVGLKLNLGFFFDFSAAGERWDFTLFNMCFFAVFFFFLVVKFYHVFVSLNFWQINEITFLFFYNFWWNFNTILTLIYFWVCVFFAVFLVCSLVLCNFCELKRNDGKLWHSPGKKKRITFFSSKISQF